jgi:hypothetical protein
MATDIYHRFKHPSTSLDLPDMQLLFDIDELFSSLPTASQLELTDEDFFAAQPEVCSILLQLCF